MKNIKIDKRKVIGMVQIFLLLVLGFILKQHTYIYVCVCVSVCVYIFLTLVHSSKKSYLLLVDSKLSFSRRLSNYKKFIAITRLNL